MPSEGRGQQKLKAQTMEIMKGKGGIRAALTAWSREGRRRQGSKTGETRRKMWRRVTSRRRRRRRRAGRAAGARHRPRPSVIVMAGAHLSSSRGNFSNQPSRRGAAINLELKCAILFPYQNKRWNEGIRGEGGEKVERRREAI